MTHPTPTARGPSASPPPRGEGLGVGGIPLAIFATALLLATQATAQIIPTGTPAADILLSQAIAEHRIFLTCSALDAVTHAQILQNWQRDVTAAAAILTANAIPPEAIAAFQAAAKPENLLPAAETPFDAVKALCDSNPDWQTRYDQQTLTVLALKLPQAFP